MHIESIALILLLVWVYTLPLFIAFGRHHHNRKAILALNILLGWTFIGWAIAIIMALTPVRKELAA